LEAALEAELAEIIYRDNQEEGINRHGHGSKLLRTSEGSMELSTPRDHLAEAFEPGVKETANDIS
jgi:transposase-like protein